MVREDGEKTSDYHVVTMYWRNVDIIKSMSETVKLQSTDHRKIIETL